MKIRFSGFWQTFQTENNFFTKYLRSLGFEVHIEKDSSKYVDLEFVSVFPARFTKYVGKIDSLVSRKYQYGNTHIGQLIKKQLKRKPKAKRVIWYTGENVRPPLELEFDLYLSFDQNSFGGKNLYFPLWKTHLDWFNTAEHNSRAGVEIKSLKLCEFREIKSSKNGLAVIFLSNPHPYRLEVIKYLESKSGIKVYGDYVSKRVDSKIEVSRNFKYSIAFENDSFPGYVTEKLLEAYVSETVPIYWGDLGKEKAFNNNAYIDFSDFSDLDSWYDELVQCDYEKIYNEPLFNYQPNIDDFRIAIAKLL